MQIEMTTSVDRRAQLLKMSHGSIRCLLRGNFRPLFVPNFSLKSWRGKSQKMSNKIKLPRMYSFIYIVH